MQDKSFSEKVGIDLTWMNVASVCQQTVRLANLGYREGAALANKKVFTFVKQPKACEENKAREYSQEYLKNRYLVFIGIDNKNEDTGVFSFPPPGGISFLCLHNF